VSISSAQINIHSGCRAGNHGININADNCSVLFPENPTLQATEVGIAVCSPGYYSQQTINIRFRAQPNDNYSALFPENQMNRNTAARLPR
jgi:hypothetical protein